jgi:hypothetical protein
MMRGAAVKQGRGMHQQGHQTRPWRMTLYRTLRVMKVRNTHSDIKGRKLKHAAQDAAQPDTQ